MKSVVSLPEAGSATAPALDLRAQLAAYVAQQPAPKQSFHKWMRMAEFISLALPVGVFAIALDLSFGWKTVSAPAIAAAWFCLPISFTPSLILVGVHGIGLRAWPPTGLFGKAMRVYLPMTGQDKTLPLRVGDKAAAWGWGTILLAVLVGVFWGAVAWVVWTTNLALLEPLLKVLGVALGVLILGRILLSIYQKLMRSR